MPLSYEKNEFILTVIRKKIKIYYLYQMLNI
jgi:hypothetical protein